MTNLLWYQVQCGQQIYQSLDYEYYNISNPAKLEVAN